MFPKEQFTSVTNFVSSLALILELSTILTKTFSFHYQFLFTDKLPNCSHSSVDLSVCFYIRAGFPFPSVNASRELVSCGPNEIQTTPKGRQDRAGPRACEP